jgi:hypothetical protein
VAVVGPAPYLKNYELGSLIDQYDVVCRVNEVHIPEQYELSYGSRTDVIFHNLNSNEGIRDLENHLSKYSHKIPNIKILICPQYRFDDKNVDIVEMFNKKNKHKIPFFHVGDDFVSQAQKSIGSKPTTGVLSVLKLLEFNLKELFVTGFSFYSEGNLSLMVYRHDLTLRNGAPFMGGELSHAQAPLKSYFVKKIIENKNLIKIDSYLQNILNVGYNNVLKL